MGKIRVVPAGSPSTLVIAQADSPRFFVVEFLKARGWTVHGIRRIEHAPSILQSLAYDLIIIDSKFPCLFNAELLRNAIEHQTVPVFLITNSLSSDFAEEATEHGVFLARESRIHRRSRRQFEAAGRLSPTGNS